MSNQKDSTPPDKSQAPPVANRLARSMARSMAGLPPAPVAPPTTTKTMNGKTPEANAPAPVETAEDGEQEREIFRPYTLDELLAEPPKTWLIEGVLAPGEISMIYGPYGVGKTYVVIDLIMAAITGQAWANSFAVSRPLSVAYCAGEGTSGLPGRFGAAAHRWGITQEQQDRLTVFKDIVQLKQPGQYDMARFVNKWKGSNRRQLDLLVIDTLHTAIEGADENSSKDMGEAFGQLRVATRALGCAVLLVHHTNKAGKYRGSSSMPGSAECMIELTDGPPTMHPEKVKDGPKWEPKSFGLISTPNGCPYVDWHEGEVRAKAGAAVEDAKQDILDVLDDAGEWLESKTLATRIGKKQSYTIQLLDKLVEDGQVRVTLKDPGKQGSSRNPRLYGSFTNSSFSGK